MIGLDTNVLLRLFVVDDPRQCERARRFVTQAVEDEPAFVNAIVLSEFAWALDKNMKKPKSDVAKLLSDVLDADDLRIAHREAALKALIAYRRGRADFADYYIAEVNAESGCATTATFDKAAEDHSSFSPVP